MVLVLEAAVAVATAEPVTKVSPSDSEGCRRSDRGAEIPHGDGWNEIVHVLFVLNFLCCL